MENEFYRLAMFGSKIELGKAKPGLKDWPDLDKFHVAISKNGGPIALMLNDAKVLVGQEEKDLKNFIFVFSSYG